MISLPLLEKSLTLREAPGGTQVFDPVRRGWFLLTREEHVRQLLLAHLVDDLSYPPSLIAVERKLEGPLPRRFDLVVFSRDTHQPWMLVECKEPDVRITETTLHQLLAYQKTIGARYWLLTNGLTTFCADAASHSAIRWMDALPPYEL